jgi:hypothetical protein
VRWRGHGDRDGDRTGLEEDVFFFEKKNQKTFAFLVPRKSTSGDAGARVRVFCFFFSKKKTFFLSEVPP